MSNPNLGWMFYKDYFRGIDFSNIANSKDNILKKTKNLINQTISITEENPLGNTHFKATTTYPGLLLGSGYLHELPDIEGQAILGFDFDYTTGLPIIRGSSIKGVLRSAFKEPEYIKELLGGETSVSQIKELEIEIFGQTNGSNQVVPGKDIFFDAEIISNGQILADDHLAPHGDNPLKNPIPLRFIKVLPNVTFRFDFELHDGIISKKEKAKLFQAILEDLGLGAKTNVGYGKFEKFANYKTQKEKELEKEQEEQKAFENIKTVADIKEFKQKYPSSKYLEDISNKEEELKQKEEKEEIEKKFKALDKSKKNHVNSFIKKYKDNPLAKEYIEQLENSSQNKVQKLSQQSLDEILSLDDPSKIKNILNQYKQKNKIFKDEELELIEKRVVDICQTLKKNKKTKFIRKISLDKIVNKEFEEKIKKSLEI